MNKTICLVTNWYPTKDNMTQGCFFKEQAFAVSDYYDFVIFRYQELFRKNPFQKDKFFESNMEGNTIEYSAIAYIPFSVFLNDILRKFIVFFRKQSVEGIGRYASKRRQRLTRKKIVKLFAKVSQKIDVFYCVDAQTEAFNLQCLSEAYGKPYIVGEHAPVPWPGSQILDINKYAIENADAFLAISNDKIRQLLLQNIKLPKTIYIGNLIDETKLQYNDKRENVEKTLLIVAAHSFYKNYDMFIQVMNRLVDITDVFFRVMIVGYAANKGYSKNIEEFEAKIRASQFADRVEMIKEVPHEEIGNVYSKADAFVMTSIQEGQPVSAMEAACCGLPIFTTRCGGVEDYLDEEMGRVYSVTDVDGMAKGIKDYLEGTISFEANVIRKRIISMFGLEKFVRTFVETFSGVIDNDPN